MATRQIEEWLVSDGMGEYVAYYNHTGHVMHFTRDRDEARKTTDSYDAAEVARVARTLYGRKNMRIGMA
jgi:hypothetical protein